MARAETMKYLFHDESLYVHPRYELKFVVPANMVGPISDFASVYCSIDKYSAMSENCFYRVNNLYFDTPNYLFLRKRIEGSENRFNMRIRTYSDTTSMPCRFEIKQKNVNIIRKYKVVIHDENWHRLFEDDGYGLYNEEDIEASSIKKLFLRMAYSYNAAPKVLSQYLRKAYISDVDDYARITFDTDLRYQPADGYNLIPDENKMVPLDDETLFDPDCSVVLELKCNVSQVPLWMIDLIRHFDLFRRSFSKYVTGVSNVLKLYKSDPGLRQAAVFLQ